MVHSVGLSQRFRLRAGIDLAASILMAAAAMVLIWRATSAPTNTEPTLVVPSEAISIAETPTMGDESAPVVMIEYSDFQCPFCSRFATQVLPELRHEYVSKGALRLDPARELWKMKMA